MNVSPTLFVSDLLSQPWAMEPGRLRGFIGELVAGAAMVDAATIKAAKESGSNPNGGAYSKDNGVARIAVHGVVLKSVPCVFGFFGIDATSTTGTVKAIEAALADEEVTAIVLDVDSPGGTVAGVQELADHVWGASKTGGKPITAEISDLAASAAYWIASQAQRLDVNESGAVGSIGVYTVIDDASRAFENKGIKTHVISSHELKGAGVAGAPVTEAQIQDMRRNVLDYAAIFESAVARARGLNPAQIEKVATGQVWLGHEAVTLGLVDGVRGQSTKKITSGSTPTVVGESINAPLIGEQEIEMTKDVAPVATTAADDVEKLRAEAEKAKAEIAAAKQVIEAMKAQQLADLMARYENRIAPAAKEAVETLGRQMDSTAQFEDYLKALPEVTRPERSGADAGMLGRTYAADESPEQAKELCKILGNTQEKHRRIAAYGEHVKFVRQDGTAVLFDGREFKKDELDKALGLV